MQHLYYYACIAPSLFFFASPFAFFWNGVHLLISPGASHSGWEDHLQSDIFHYLHHRYFECNYAGSDAGFLDYWFGTFCGSLNSADSADGAKLRVDAKSTLRAPPTTMFLSYLFLACGSVAVWAYVAASHIAVTPTTALALGIAAGFGPAIAAVIVSSAAAGEGGSPLFDKRKSFLGSAVQFVVGNAVCTVPIAFAAWLTLSPPA